MVIISHDSYARESITREVVHTTTACTFCGGNNKSRLFRYGVIKDSNPYRHSLDTKLFCSLLCRLSYYS